MQKKKILLLSDHAASTSGVGTQSRWLMDGLIKKGDWTVRQLGAAIKHTNYDTVKLNDDFYIKPIDGFGDRAMIRHLLVQEKPDVLMIFTDPRFFTWLFEMEDEVHQICPIAWWHVWDNLPIPTFNNFFYRATDLLNCHSYLTYEMVKTMEPKKTNFVPHAVPEEFFYPLDEKTRIEQKIRILGEAKKDHFVVLWINRNAKRKRSADVLEAWKLFTDELKLRGKSDVTLLMHTDPFDVEGPNLVATGERLGILDSIVFSRDRLPFEAVNVIHNISDCCLNISYAEGFGLGTLEAMMTGRPIIAIKTGGLTRQVIDHRDQSENGIALPVEFRTTVGSQSVPAIYEDYVSNETVAKSIMKMYDMGSHQRYFLGQKALRYARTEFSYQKTVDMWDASLKSLLLNWKQDYKRWHLENL